jgi:hypothetical protein
MLFGCEQETAKSDNCAVPAANSLPLFALLAGFDGTQRASAGAETCGRSPCVRLLPGREAAR